MMNVTAVAANAPAMAALQENGVRPASGAAGKTTSRSIIAVSVIKHSFARVLCPEPRVLPPLRTRSTAVLHSSSVGGQPATVFLGKINKGTRGFRAGSTCDSAGDDEMTAPDA
jgi:hypothetical protein